jgi:hypothetical protein
VKVFSLLLLAGAVWSGNAVLIAAAGLHALIFIPLSNALDKYRRSIAIDYRTDADTDKVFRAINMAFEDLKGSARVWSVEAQGMTTDWKRNAGANTLVKRHQISPGSERPSCIRGHLTCPTISLGRLKLHLLPDVMLMVEPGGVAALRYDDFEVHNTQVRFTEEEAVPRDALVLGQTWKYVNRKGGPDRRFNFNKQLPICLYGEMQFLSGSGLNAVLQYSAPNAGERLDRVLEVLRSLAPALSEKRLIASFKFARSWPSIALVGVTVVSGAIILLLMQPGARDYLRLVRSSVAIEPSTKAISEPAQPSPKPRENQRPTETRPILPPPLNINPSASYEKQTTPAPRPRPVTP